MTTPLDVARLRADFPALDGDAPSRFDGPGGTQVPRAVIEAMGEVLVHANANSHWEFPASRAVDRLLDGSREAFATFLGAHPDEVVFGANMTTLTFHVARGLARGWREGDEIIVTELDHHGNVAPWQAVADERGLVLRWLPLDPTSGQLQLERLPSLLGPRTRLLAIGAASNALGTVVDVASAARLAHAAGALVFVDAVHYAPHRLIDVSALGADLLACSPYKFYGPHLGVLWGRYDLLARIDAPRLIPQPQEPPERLQLGTASFEAIAGATAALGWLAEVGGGSGALTREALGAAFDALHARETILFGRLWEGLGALPGVRRFGPPPGDARTGTVSITATRVGPAELAVRLAEAGCWASHGNFYAWTAAERCGVQPDGWLRLGLAAYTSDDDVSRVLAALDRILTD
jgi:cysteine desulfurase family protein (TIGR01976 family)